MATYQFLGRSQESTIRAVANLYAAIGFQKQNEVAENTAFGGKYSAPGIVNADQEDALNAADQIEVQQLMAGLSGTNMNPTSGL